MRSQKYNSALLAWSLALLLWTCVTPALAQEKVRFPIGASSKTFSYGPLWLGQKLGWDKAPGAQFSIERPTSGDYQITSTGGGHGVGMCQWGASAMARRRNTYRQILHFYVPDARLRKLTQRGI